MPLVKQVSLGVTSARNWLPTALPGHTIQVSRGALLQPLLEVLQQ